MSMEIMIPSQEVSSEELEKRIWDFEAMMKKFPQVQIPVEDFFTPGIYVRQIILPKGIFCTGSIYKQEHIHIVLSGDMTVATKNGIMRVRGPHTFIAPPGLKRAGYTHEETVWAAVFRTDKLDPAEIMDDMTVEEFYKEGVQV